MIQGTWLGAGEGMSLAQKREMILMLLAMGAQGGQTVAQTAEKIITENDTALGYGLPPDELYKIFDAQDPVKTGGRWRELLQAYKPPPPPPPPSQEDEELRKIADAILSAARSPDEVQALLSKWTATTVRKIPGDPSPDDLAKGCFVIQTGYLRCPDPAGSNVKPAWIKAPQAKRLMQLIAAMTTPPEDETKPPPKDETRPPPEDETKPPPEDETDPGEGKGANGGKSNGKGESEDKPLHKQWYFWAGLVAAGAAGLYLIKGRR